MDASPRITHLSWGRLEADVVGIGKDLKLYPGGGREWDWNETGTRHSPGIQPVDVTELLDAGATVVVLAQGMQGQLQVMPETLALLAERGVAVHVADTEEAVRRYNELVATDAVGGLFHSTC